MAAMFTKSKNNHFNNASFTINNTTNFNTDKGQGVHILYNSVAPNAILNAGGRADEARCHPGTRTEVIGLIDNWRLDIQNKVKPNQLFWLSGPAGAGKTAIVQTIAENWKLEGIHTANFFFFRTDPSRSHAKSFISTLLYQIFDFFPAAREAVDQVLTLKPRILESGLDEQIDELICNTFRSIQPPFSEPIVLLIDGLDECDSEMKTSQKQILCVLDKLVRQEDLPFIVLVASRAEPHISAEFRQLTSQAQSIFLNDQYSPERDIRRFVTAEFEKIKTSHPHADFLPKNWPSDSDIDAIVDKSSGQFIYSATVMRFLAQSSAVPSLSLEKVRGVIPCAKNSPFIHLDAIYAYILQQADDGKAVHDILSSALLDRELNSPLPTRYNRSRGRLFPAALGRPRYMPPIPEFLRLYDSRYTEALFTSCISEISSIVQVHNGRLEFYHASLSDFLLDRSRSDRFHVDISQFASNVLPRVWNYHNPFLQSIGKSLPLGLKLLSYVQHSTPAVTNTLLTELPSDLDDFLEYVEYGAILENISRLYYPLDRESYKKILKHWVIWAVSMSDTDEDLQILDDYSKPMTELDSLDSQERKTIPLLGRYLLAARIQKRMGRAVKIFKH